MAIADTMYALPTLAISPLARLPFPGVVVKTRKEYVAYAAYHIADEKAHGIPSDRLVKRDDKKQHKIYHSISKHYRLKQQIVPVGVHKLNDVVKVSNKIKILTSLKTNIKYNLNANLLMDKLVILLSEV